MTLAAGLSPGVNAAKTRSTFTTMEVVKGQKVHTTPPDFVDDDLIKLSDNAKKVLERRYLRRDIDGSTLETIAGMFYRVADHVANVETQHGGDADATTQTFYNLLTELRFFPNSPTFTGAGTPLGQLAACFVLPIEDDMGRSSDGIFSTLRVAALIQQTGGGNGFSFSRLRPKSDVVHTSSGRATGPVGFLRVYDQAFGEIAQGGTRRGANMGVLRVDHPDIEQFIQCKAEEGMISNFNISVAITDEFMRAVKADEDFDLRNPRDGKVWKSVRARDLFDKIINYAHHNGEPGALFIDAADRSNPVPHLYDLEATDPCVTGDTLIYTGNGLQSADALFKSQEEAGVVIDSRFGDGDFSAYASRIFYTGRKRVYRLRTKEGYQIKATANHQIMTSKGWVALEQLSAGDKVHILNHKGQFGAGGNLGLGRTMGWLLGDGTFNIANAAGLMFFGQERELAPMFAECVTDIAEAHGHGNTYAPTRTYPVGVQDVTGRDESRVISTRLKEQMAQLGFTDKQRVPEIVFCGTEEMQKGFLQSLFTADGTVIGTAEKRSQCSSVVKRRRCVDGCPTTTVKLWHCQSYLH